MTEAVEAVKDGDFLTRSSVTTIYWPPCRSRGGNRIRYSREFPSLRWVKRDIQREVHVLDVNGMAGFLSPHSTRKTFAVFSPPSDGNGRIGPQRSAWPPARTTVGQPLRLIDATRDDESPFVHAAPLLEAVEATRADGASRRVRLGDEGERQIEITLCHNADGSVMLGFGHLDEMDDSDGLRRLTREMAAETDTATLLEILCDAAATQ